MCVPSRPARVDFGRIRSGTSLANRQIEEDRAWAQEASAMTAKMGIREGAVSAIVFSAILFALISFDPRVKTQVADTLRSGSAWTWSNRFGEIGSALWSAARDKSMD